MPTSGVNITVEELQYVSFIPASICPACQSKWEESGLEGAVRVVNWESVLSTKDVASLVSVWLIYLVCG